MSSPSIERLIRESGLPVLDMNTHDDFVGRPGESILFFAGDPGRFSESNDVAVILPELLKTFAGRLRGAVVGREAEKALAARYGVNRWPTLVVVRAGDYLGQIAGMQDWPVFAQQVQAMLEGAPTRPPTVGVPVVSAGAGTCSTKTI
jgi:hydrogenase-1 operon protein HyaE